MNILRYEDNGIEFFTIQTTGESGMSQSGLARLCGVGADSVSKLLKSVMTSSSPEFLKPLQSQELTLMTSVHEFKNATILKDIVCAKILEWYAFESQRTNDTARQAFRQFASIGIRHWIQDLTGWQRSCEEKIPFNSSIPSPDTEVDKIPDLTELLTQINNLEHTLLVSLKHRHAIHNVVEKPTVVDLSLNRVIHTSIHEQGVKLNDALKQINSLRQIVLHFHHITSVVEQNHSLWRNFQQVCVLVEQLQRENKQLQSTNDDSHKTNQDLIEENQRLVKCYKEQQQRLQILCKRRQIDSSVTINIDSGYSSILDRRIEELTKLFLADKKQKNNSRTIKTCHLKATMLARYELGESLNSIASELGYSYETVKTYIKLARRFIRNKAKTIN